MDLNKHKKLYPLLTALERSLHSPEIRSSKAEIDKLLSDIIQITYTTRSQAGDEKPRYSLRSSIWKHNNSEWKMVFHQGTITKQERNYLTSFSLRTL